MALTIVEDGDDLVLRLVLVALGKIAEELAVAIGLPVVEVAQNEWSAGDREWLVDRARKRGSGINDIDVPNPSPSLIWFSLPSCEAGNTPIS